MYLRVQGTQGKWPDCDLDHDPTHQDLDRAVAGGLCHHKHKTWTSTSWAATQELFSQGCQPQHQHKSAASQAEPFGMGKTSLAQALAPPPVLTMATATLAGHSRLPLLQTTCKSYMSVCSLLSQLTCRFSMGL